MIKKNQNNILTQNRFKSSSISIFSFFSGAGFLDLGFEDSGFQIDYVNEFHSPFMRAYIESRKLLRVKEPEHGYHCIDIEELRNEQKCRALAKFIKQSKSSSASVGFIGGPPCPDFSIGGKNRGHTGDNGKLTGNYIDLICKQEPDFFLFENVKGLWRTKRHREFFEEMKVRLQKAGYLTCERLINAIEYGAPQDRERIILIGFRGDFLKSLGYKLKSSDDLQAVFPWDAGVTGNANQIFSLPWPEQEKFKENLKRPFPGGVKKELTVEYWFIKNKVESHPNSKDCFVPRQALSKFKSILEGDDSKKSFKRLHRWRYSPTACYGNNEVHLHPYKARRLNVAEVLAIQSLPADFVLPSDIGLSNLFKTVGNGVPYLAAKGLAQSIKLFLKGGL